MRRLAIVTLFALVVSASTSNGQGANPLDAAKSKFVTHDGRKVHYKNLGDGDTALVLVHGWTCDMSFWRDQVSAFAPKMRVVLLDLPGHGKSDKPEVDYTMERFAKAVDAVLVDAGVKHAILAGHSMGTPVIRQYYRLHPKKVKGLIAVDGSLRPFANPEALAPFIAGLAGPDGKAQREKMIDGMFVEITTPETRKQIKEVMLAAPTHVAVSAMKGMADPAIWKDDPITVPMQSIVTKHKMWANDYEGFVKKLCPHIDYRVMDGVGHFLHMEKPAEFNAIMGEFVTKVQTGKPQ